MVAGSWSGLPTAGSKTVGVAGTDSKLGVPTAWGGVTVQACVVVVMVES